MHLSNNLTNCASFGQKISVSRSDYAQAKYPSRMMTQILRLRPIRISRTDRALRKGDAPPNKNDSRARNGKIVSTSVLLDLPVWSQM
jgi:hypothetical protein